MRSVLLVGMFLGFCGVAQADYNWVEWAECPDGGTGHLYALTEPMMWADAEAAAVAEGGHLVSILTAEENDWLVETFAASGENHVWIGLKDIDLDGNWEWTSGEFVSYLNWYEDPSGSEHPSLLYLNSDSEHTGFWADHYDVAMPAIIEKEPCELAGDVDGDGDVDLVDLAMVLADYGRTCD